MGGATKMVDEIEILRDFLLRSISDNNLVFTKYFSNAYRSNRDGYKRSYTKMLNLFMQDNSDIKNTIFTDMAQNHPGYKVYQYFDIDTLYAYLTYQNKILEYIQEEVSDKANPINIPKLDSCIERAGQWLHSPKVPRKDKGYFDGKIYVVRNTQGGKSKFAPKKPLQINDFKKIYNGVDFDALKKEHIILRHTPKAKLVKHNNVEYVEYLYNGEVLTLQVEEKTGLVTKHQSPVYIIKARGEAGVLEIALDYFGNIYTDQIYRIGRTPIEGLFGKEVFYPREKTSNKNAKSDVPSQENFAEKKLTTYTKDDQISLI